MDRGSHGEVIGFNEALRRRKRRILIGVVIGVSVMILALGGFGLYILYEINRVLGGADECIMVQDDAGVWHEPPGCVHGRRLPQVPSPPDASP